MLAAVLEHDRKVIRVGISCDVALPKHYPQQCHGIVRTYLRRDSAIEAIMVPVALKLFSTNASDPPLAEYWGWLREAR